MHPGSKLILAGFLLLVGTLFVLTMGPLGLLLLPFGLIVAGIVLLTTGGDTGTSPENCADCGAPNEADAEECQYCGAPI